MEGYKQHLKGTPQKKSDFRKDGPSVDGMFSL